MSSESLAPEKSYSIVFLAPTTTSPQDGKLVSTQRAKGFNLSWTNYGLSSTSTSTITTISGTRTTTQTYLTIGQQVTISADAMFSTTPAGEAETWADTGPSALTLQKPVLVTLIIALPVMILILLIATLALSCCLWWRRRRRCGCDSSGTRKQDENQNQNQNQPGGGGGGGGGGGTADLVSVAFPRSHMCRLGTDFGHVGCVETTKETERTVNVFKEAERRPGSGSGYGPMAGGGGGSNARRRGGGGGAESWWDGGKKGKGYHHQSDFDARVLSPRLGSPKVNCGVGAAREQSPLGLRGEQHPPADGHEAGPRGGGGGGQWYVAPLPRTGTAFERDGEHTTPAEPPPYNLGRNLTGRRGNVISRG